MTEIMTSNITVSNDISKTDDDNTTLIDIKRCFVAFKCNETNYKNFLATYE